MKGDWSDHENRGVGGGFRLELALAVVLVVAGAASFFTGLF